VDLASATKGIYPKGVIDAHIAHIRVKRVGVNGALNDLRAKVNTFRSQSLHEGLGHNAAAHITAGGSCLGEVTRLVNVEMHIDICIACHFLEEVTEKGPRWTAAHHSNTAALA
jgi:hypothetical protein